jgi:hypothetical protein
LYNFNSARLRRPSITHFEAKTMFLDSGRAIAEKIQHLIDGEVAEPIRFAVAFWGNGADYKLRGACEIICDLESGACNPAVIRTLSKRDNCVVLKLSGLHAKVVIGSAGAVVSSANMSTNGLGAEGADSSGTIEAGYFVPASAADYKKVVMWFKGVWAQATQITESDLGDAQEKWDFRNREMPLGPAEKPEFGNSPFNIDPAILLEEAIDPDDRLRAVKGSVFSRLEVVLPHVNPRRLGKIATWACHLLLNRAGLTLQHAAGPDGGSGPATDQWIMSRFGTKKKDETVANVAALLVAISRDSYFSADIRRATNQVLSAPPWVGQDRSSDSEQ